MPSLLVKNAALLVTMDDADTRWDGWRPLRRATTSSSRSGRATTLPATGGRSHRRARHGRSCPGWSTRTTTSTRRSRAICRPRRTPTCSHWLRTLYPIWAGLTPEAIAVSTQDRHRRADALRLHHVQRPHLHLAQRRAARRPDRRPRARWASASTPRAARCRSANRRAACRPISVVEDEDGDPARLAAADRAVPRRRRATPCCASCWRPARPSPSRPT